MSDLQIDADKMARLFDDGNEHLRTRISALEREIESEQISKEILLGELDRLKYNAALSAKQSKLHEENNVLHRQVAQVKSQLRSATRRLKDQQEAHVSEISRLRAVITQLQGQVLEKNKELDQSGEVGKQLQTQLLGETEQRLKNMTHNYHKMRTRLEECEKALEAASVGPNVPREQTVRYVVREAGPDTPSAHIDKIVRTRAADANSAKMSVNCLIFKSREQALAKGQLSVVLRNYENMKTAHASLLVKHQALQAEYDVLVHREKKMRSKMKSKDLNTAYLLAAQKSALTRQKLKSNLYKSRQPVEQPILDGILMSSSSSPLLGTADSPKNLEKTRSLSTKKARIDSKALRIPPIRHFNVDIDRWSQSGRSGRSDLESSLSTKPLSRS